MKKTLSIIFAFLAISFVLSASAHEELTDRQITILTHINPGDDPIAGINSTILINVLDSTGRFDVSKCNCNIRISEQGRELLNKSLDQTDTSTPTIYQYSKAFTFPKKDVYHIDVYGNPIDANDFQKFDVGFDIRVDKEVPKESSKLYLIAGISVLVIGSAGAYLSHKKINK